MKRETVSQKINKSPSFCANAQRAQNFWARLPIVRYSLDANSLFLHQENHEICSNRLAIVGPSNRSRLSSAGRACVEQSPLCGVSQSHNSALRSRFESARRTDIWIVGVGRGSLVRPWRLDCA